MLCALPEEGRDKLVANGTSSSCVSLPCHSATPLDTSMPAVRLEQVAPEMDPSKGLSALRIDSPAPLPSVNDSTAQDVDAHTAEALDAHLEGRVLVLYTGGTIGMVKNSAGALAPLPNALVQRLRSNAAFHDAEYAKIRFGADSGPLVLPSTGGSRRVLYTIKEYDPLLDSSNMGVEDWIRIATDIKKNYELYDGFLILHGTDTLAYTSSALSFMLENLGKSVVVTGSQIPLWELRSDGRDNLIVSLMVAGGHVIPEVTVVFGSRVLRGNRIVKVNSDALNAFDSPNFPPLASIGIDIEVNYRLIHRPKSLEPFAVHGNMSSDVGLLRIFPNISATAVRSFLAPPLQGAVLQTYGAGNMPSTRGDLLNELQAAAARGVVLVNCTQCMRGRVSELYESGKALEGIGVISGADMTPEAALAKLAYVLSKDEWDMYTKKERLRGSLRGELTLRSAGVGALRGWEALDTMLAALEAEPAEVVRLLSPALMCVAAARPTRHGAATLATLIAAGGDLSAATCSDQRTPLHVAASEGNLDALRLLLEHGASVHAKDRYGRTPLMDAVLFDRHDAIRVLRQCGAHLDLGGTAVGDRLCSVVASGDIRRLESFRLAGANMAQIDSTGRTALHVAATLGKAKAVMFLLESGTSAHVLDACGNTPADLARIRGHKALEATLRRCAQDSPSQTASPQ